jgi:hypothetical protein
MIHTLRGAARRIAVVEIPRSASNRLGRIGSIRNYDWNTIPEVAPLTDEPYLTAQPFTASGAVDKTPPTTAAWLARIISAQSHYRETTPGTLTYTPAPTIPAPPVARWNSWAGPCDGGIPATSTSSGSGGASSSTTAPAAGFSAPTLLYVAAAIGAAASLAYIFNTAVSGEGRK